MGTATEDRQTVGHTGDDLPTRVGGVVPCTDYASVVIETVRRPGVKALLPGAFQ